MTTFEVWAPNHDQVRLRTLGNDHEMAAAGDGLWRVTVPEAGPGDDYGFLLGDDDTPLPDPRSRWQPEGVHGLSRLHDPQAYEWDDGEWTGRQLAGAVVYELHVGTFTPEGTFAAATEKLDHLAELGVDLVEVLPVNAVNGTHNWGYDGVGWYAVHDPYGGPDAFKAFVDACHRRGIGVVLDVVYNHLGPSGAYLPRFAPFFKPGKSTWGDLVNLDGPGSEPVRRYILDNAQMWLHEFHVDGLRLDAVHALVDLGAIHILEEMAVEVDALSAHLRRPLTLIAESDLNDPRLIRSRDAGGYGLTAQWDDDVHHALHALLTGEQQGYYSDFGSLGTLAKAFTGAFVHDGSYSSFRGRLHGRRVNRDDTPAYRFVAFLQDHDQVGNRALGDRLSGEPGSLSPQLLKVGAALLLTSPFTPMLWMGEEWGATTPWQFFTSHPEPELAAAVAHGRREEFAAHGWDTEDVPDPQDPATFQHSKLDWAELTDEKHADVLDFYRRLTQLRRARPELSDPRLDRVDVTFDEDARWLVVHRGGLRVAVNLAAERQEVPLDGTPISVLLSSVPGFVYRDGAVELEPGSTAVVELAVRTG
ncbi:MAG TPA: malto-oligosyltrehalose trehalohydrolase [Mycobacteriales bacterium]|jgi:maltooligosyltrehalose trehalohydrolase|nr:malto-oligosyltrehalose trehalohydrolase [Mycobacteriales bacterium]